MKRFIEGADRGQPTLFPECLEDWIYEHNPVRVIDVFVDGFGRVDPKSTGRPSYHPSALLKLYVYGYLNRVQSSRRSEHEAGRNVECDVADGVARSRSQDDCRFPKRQRPRHPSSLHPVRCALPHDGPFR